MKKIGKIHSVYLFIVLFSIIFSFQNCSRSKLDRNARTEVEEASLLVDSRSVESRSVDSIIKTEPKISSSYYYVDSLVAKNKSYWSKNYVPEIVTDKRTTIMWGSKSENSSSDAYEWSENYLQNLTHNYYQGLRRIDKVYYPSSSATSTLRGPSLEGDVLVRRNQYRHLIRAIVPKTSSKSFFTSYDSNGQNASGANSNILAIYSEFNPRWWVMKPWGSGDITNPKLRAAFRTTQRVPWIWIPDPANQQLQQNLRFVFLNKYCYENNMSSSPTFCQFEVNFKLFVKGVHAFSFDSHATAFSDSGQNGMRVIYGPINSEGKNTQVWDAKNQRTLPVWTSWGANTKNSVFNDDTTFQAEISWAQFTNIVNIVSGYDPVKFFGAQWKDNTNWYLLRAGYGQ